MDMEKLILYVIVGLFAIAFFRQVLPALSSFLGGRGKPIKTEKPIDWIRVMYKQHKLAAKLGKRDINGRIHIKGEGEIQDIHYKFVGCLAGPWVYEFFWKPHWYNRPRWVLVPKQLVSSLHARNINIRCRGFMPYDDIFWIPIPCVSDIPIISKLMDAIKYHIDWMAAYQGHGIVTQNMLDAVATASHTKVLPPGVYADRGQLIVTDTKGQDEGSFSEGDE